MIQHPDQRRDVDDRHKHRKASTKPPRRTAPPSVARRGRRTGTRCRGRRRTRPSAPRPRPRRAPPAERPEQHEAPDRDLEAEGASTVRGRIARRSVESSTATPTNRAIDSVAWINRSSMPVHRDDAVVLRVGRSARPMPAEGCCTEPTPRTTRRRPAPDGSRFRHQVVALRWFFAAQRGCRNLRPPARDLQAKVGMDSGRTLPKRQRSTMPMPRLALGPAGDPPRNPRRSGRGGRPGAGGGSRHPAGTGRTGPAQIDWSGRISAWRAAPAPRSAITPSADDDRRTRVPAFRSGDSTRRSDAGREATTAVGGVFGGYNWQWGPGSPASRRTSTAPT